MQIPLNKILIIFLKRKEQRKEMLYGSRIQSHLLLIYAINLLVR